MPTSLRNVAGHRITYEGLRSWLDDAKLPHHTSRIPLGPDALRVYDPIPYWLNEKDRYTTFWESLSPSAQTWYARELTHEETWYNHDKMDAATMARLAFQEISTAEFTYTPISNHTPISLREAKERDYCLALYAETKIECGYCVGTGYVDDEDNLPHVCSFCHTTGDILKTDADYIS